MLTSYLKPGTTAHFLAKDHFMRRIQSYDNTNNKIKATLKWIHVISNFYNKHAVENHEIRKSFLPRHIHPDNFQASCVNFRMGALAFHPFCHGGPRFAMDVRGAEAV